MAKYIPQRGDPENSGSDQAKHSRRPTEVGLVFPSQERSVLRDGRYARREPLFLPQRWKAALARNPALKSKDRKSQIHEIDIDLFPSDALNLMAEPLDSAGGSLLNDPEMYPPPDAHVTLKHTSSTDACNARFTSLVEGFVRCQLARWKMTPTSAATIAVQTDRVRTRVQAYRLLSLVTTYLT
jgi:hypothetical protein